MDAVSGVRSVMPYAPLTDGEMSERVRLYNSPEERKKRLMMYVKPEDGPWRAEFTRGLCGSVAEAEGLWQGTRRPLVRKEDMPTGLLEAIEAAASSLGFGVRGLYRMGLHEIPHSHMLPRLASEGLVITDGERVSPMAVSPEHILLQCGELPFIFPYGWRTGLRTIFANALVRESFF